MMLCRYLVEAVLCEPYFFKVHSALTMRWIRSWLQRALIILYHFVHIYLEQHITDVRVPALLLTKNPGLSRTPMNNFPGPFRSLRMFKYKEKQHSDRV